MRSVTVPLTTPREVSIDFGILCAVEKFTGKNLNQVFLSDLPAYFVPGVTRSEELTDEQRRDLAKRWNVTFMTGFVAACLGETPQSLGKHLPMHKLVPVFYQLLDVFYEAVAAFNSGEEASGPQTASTASTPGDGSSSASSPTA